MVQAVENSMALKDLPKALMLLGEMNVSAQHVASLVDNMIQKVRKGELTTDQGLSFLEMKYNMLLSYLINLTYVVLRKCSGEKIEGDPSIDRLIEIRTILEKIRPIDHKLKYQIDKLVKTAVSGAGTDDPTTFKANPQNLVGKDGFENSGSESSDESEKEKGGKTKSGIYVPPKLSAVHYTENYPETKSKTRDIVLEYFSINKNMSETDKKNYRELILQRGRFGSESAQEKNKRLQEKSKKLALSSSILQDLREEYLDTPVEVAQGSRAQQIQSKEQKERQEYEEEYMTRLPVSKSEKHKKRQLTTLGTLGDEITNFGSGHSGGGGSRKRKQKGFKSKGKGIKRKRFH